MIYVYEQPDSLACKLSHLSPAVPSDSFAPMAGAAVAIAPRSPVRSGFRLWSQPVILTPSSSAAVPCLLAPGACLVLPFGLSMTRRRRSPSGPLRVRAGAHAQLQTADVTALGSPAARDASWLAFPLARRAPEPPLRPSDPQPTLSRPLCSSFTLSPGQPAATISSVSQKTPDPARATLRTGL
jgi:hypothetical protein